MFFEHFRAENGMSQNQASNHRNLSDEMLRRNNRPINYKYSQYGTTGRRQMRDFSIGARTFKSRTATPNPENIDALEDTLNELKKLIELMQKKGRETND